MEGNKYSINCRIDTRWLGEHAWDFDDSTPQEHLAAFNRDLQDTIVELTTIVRRFDKFGDPKRQTATASNATSLKAPEKVTAAWLWNNTSVSVWWTVVAALIVVFGTGVTVGRSTLFSEIVAKLKPIDGPTRERAAPNK
jgi:hypothetical protein